MNPEWHEFIQRHLAETNSAEEELALRRAMKSDAQLRALYLDYMNLDVSLEAAAGAAEMARELEPIPRPGAGRSHAPPTWRALAALAVVLVLAAAWMLHLASTPKGNARSSIAAVKDDMGATAEMGSSSYRIIPHGLRPGSAAYADRLHVWEASAGRSFPASLMNADVVQTMQIAQSRSGRRSYALEITLTKPVELFVLMPRRDPAPAWLMAAFTRTGEEVSLLEAGSPNRSRRPFDVWKRTVRQPGKITLGPPPGLAEGRPAIMYGIAAKAF